MSRKFRINYIGRLERLLRERNVSESNIAKVCPLYLQLQEKAGRSFVGWVERGVLAILLCEVDHDILIEYLLRKFDIEMSTVKKCLKILWKLE